MFLLLLLATAGAFPERFFVCGNYCGPGWCNGDWIDEQRCDTSVEAIGCADKCCRLHDGCCATDERTGCNQQLLYCLESCGNDQACSRDAHPDLVTPDDNYPLTSLFEDLANVVGEDWVSADNIYDAMALEVEKCCGGAC